MVENKFEVGDILEEISPSLVQIDDEYLVFEVDDTRVIQVEILAVLEDGTYG